MEGDRVWLRNSPIKGVMRFGKKVKFSLRYFNPFESLSEWEMWPTNLPSHLVYLFCIQCFMSQCYGITLRTSSLISLNSMELGPNLAYDKEPVAILDRMLGS